jgi:hypothetical protein
MGAGPSRATDTSTRQIAKWWHTSCPLCSLKTSWQLRRMSGNRAAMKITSKVGRFVTGRWYAAAVVLTLVAGPSAMGGDTQVPLLKTRTGSFTNVTVTGTSKTDVYITHSRGMTNIKVADLDPESSQLLGLSTSPAPASASTKSADTAKDSKTLPKSAAPTASFPTSGFTSQLKGKMPSGFAMLERLSSLRLSAGIVTTALGLIFAAYLFICYCLKLICEKTGQKPGPMVWCPFLQMFPLLRAAGMPVWWSIGFLVPLVNIVASILWSFKIVQARGKSVWVAILLLLPITSLFALLYLAFSNGGEQKKEADQGEVPMGPLLVEA